MAKVSIYHDMRAVKPGEPGPLKVKYYHKGSTIMIPTEIKVLPEQWTGKLIINHQRAKQWNNFLDLRLLDITSEILELEVTGKLSDLSPAELKKRLLNSIGKKTTEEQPNLFIPVFKEKMESFTNSGTIGIWQNTLNRLTTFCAEKGYDLETLTFEKMTVEWLEEFDKWMAETAPKANARGINHRNIRAVFNFAKKRKKMAVPYPFDDFKIQRQDTEHIDLSIEQVRELKDYPIGEDHIRKFRDIFMLMLYLRGINSADLFAAKKSQIIDGRLEYYRKKTGAFTTVKIEPEAQEIIDRYPGEEYVLDISEKWKDPKNYLRTMDKGLKKIGPVEIKKHGKKEYKGLFKRISSNSARHTWSTLVFDLGYTIDVASEGLTHKYGSRTTNIYVHKKHRKKVDQANREVIDYIAEIPEIEENANELT